ncbi:Coenzyme F420 hydrogenase/dehydrogenase, beta subunit C-terminal domain [Promethearchaeum syntrophicum]|uniref:Coenzyme F420 hydrogenase/dehydrogenase, beta subunit C-terminal domain n=1 Tax=Promethearchaeum syntrophicum TaxID=2594042 RepID=A0A5B9DDV7_9ARCH|nr:Coenzyme F420 hydrogenase/dehydrogenase, beta subunit C-terminal domain [Candidatus Prometheoarchaeum syntrophicum]QEE16953.1 Formate dehydrogenase subunit beta [Candidatus Prometheoarchaeum syntrophicum]
MEFQRYTINKSDFQQLLKHLLKEKIVDKILSGEKKRNRFAIIPKYVTNPAEIDEFPLSQLLVYGYSRTDSASNSLLHTKESLNTKIGVIGRACDVRALIELDKKMQVNLENLFIISFHDVGYIPNKYLTKNFKKNNIDESNIAHEWLTPTELILKMKKGKNIKIPLGPDVKITDNCTRCIQKSHPLADFLIGTYTIFEKSEDYILTAQSSRAKNIIEKLKWQDKIIDEKLNAQYEKEAEDIILNCTATREKELSEFLANEDRFNLFIKCTGCGMCVKSCPVCFCTVCNLTEQVRAKTMDKVSFVMTRFTHVGDTCVECGRCQSNCPVNLPLTLVFQSLRDKFKKERGYESGVNKSQKVLHLDVK